MKFTCCRYLNTWMAFLDLDEFLVLQDGTTSILEFMKPYLQFGGLAVHWRFFGSSGLQSRPAGGKHTSSLGLSGLIIMSCKTHLTANWVSGLTLCEPINWPLNSNCPIHISIYHLAFGTLASAGKRGPPHRKLSHSHSQMAFDMEVYELQIYTFSPSVHSMYAAHSWPNVSSNSMMCLSGVPPCRGFGKLYKVQCSRW